MKEKPYSSSEDNSKPEIIDVPVDRVPVDDAFSEGVASVHGKVSSIFEEMLYDNNPSKAEVRAFREASAKRKKEEAKMAPNSSSEDNSKPEIIDVPVDRVPVDDAFSKGVASVHGKVASIFEEMLYANNPSKAEVRAFRQASAKIKKEEEAKMVPAKEMAPIADFTELMNTYGSRAVTNSEEISDQEILNGESDDRQVKKTSKKPV